MNAFLTAFSLSLPPIVLHSIGQHFKDTLEAPHFKNNDTVYWANLYI